MENNLYPFVHLNVDSNLFVFANNRGILLDYRRNAMARSFPPMPGGDPRNYPKAPLIRITDEKPAWKMEKMSVPRVMGDMLLLPIGDVLILNGASAETTGPLRSPRASTTPAPSFTTHAFAMNQRLLVLQLAENVTAGCAAGHAPGPGGAATPAAVYEVEAVAPRSSSMAPPGYYLVFVANGEVPSEGVWVRLSPPRP
ncbi:hypothetical protein Taro_038038 [Colocasia esculenta]|uniref:Galactose oxidase-like Early set domain-containing protein n=1 Tax=Colocasia esculenta TaxID=4460 RepID=A0A843W753_COLES|nr:hypothetical protein [Colocasia esculenta]